MVALQCTAPVSGFDVRPICGDECKYTSGPHLTVVLKTLYDCEERIHVKAVIGTGWNVGFQGSQTTLPSLRAATEWLADQGRVRISTPLATSCRIRTRACQPASLYPIAVDAGLLLSRGLHT